MHPPTAGLPAAGGNRTVGAPCPPRQTAHGTFGSGRSRGTADRGANPYPRTSSPLARCANSQSFLLPRRGASRRALVLTLESALAQAANRASCATHVTPHRLRHSFATEILRLGVSLPVLMKLLGHKHIRRTLLYVEVTQQDLQREFHQARQNAAHPHRLPTLALPKDMPIAGLPVIRQALEATRHLLEIYRRQLGDEKIRRRLRRLDKRLLTVASQLQRIQTEQK